MLQFINRVASAFAKPADPVEKPPTDSVLWSESKLYGNTHFQSYNPDSLIGRKGFDIYEKMLLDEQLKVAVKFRRNATTTRNWAFQYDESIEDKLSDEEKERRVDVLTQTLRRVPRAFKASLDYAMKALHQGFSITEKVFEPFEYNGNTWWGIKRLSSKPFQTFFPIEDDYGNLIRLEQEVGGARQTVDLSRIIWYVINPDVNEYYGQSELREAYRDWWNKDVFTKLEGIYLERLAGGLVWAEENVQNGAGSVLGIDDKRALEQVLSNIQTVTGIKMPRNWKLNVNNPVSTPAFSDAISRHDRNLAKSLLMPNLVGLTEQGDTGSYSQSQTQLEAFLWMLNADADDLSETLNEQLFRQLCDYNWGDGLYPEFTFKPLSQSQLYTVIDVWNKLVQSKAVEPSDTDEEYLRELLEFPVKGETRKQPTPPTVPQMPGQEQVPSQEQEQEQEQEPEVEDLDASKDHGDHTPHSAGAVHIEYKKKFAHPVTRRVDFAAIDRSTTMEEWTSAQELGDTMGELAAYLSSQVTSNDALLTSPTELEKIKVPASVIAKLKAQTKKTLSNSWEIGVRNAQRELEKAGMGRMSKASFAKFSSVGANAVKYFEAKSFTMAGALTNDALATFQNIILNGIKYDKSKDEVIADIYSTFAKKGLLNEADVIQALGEALDINNPTHRLETVIRTNSFDAINEGRYSFFTDPELGGFVVALQYSSILDGVTTDICEDLNDRTYPLDSQLWFIYRPPNHYNCRALLIAVTRMDSIQITDSPPNVAPQEGFK